MKVKYQHKHLPDGMPVHLTGLNATLLNNQEIEIPDEVISDFEQRYEVNFNDILKGVEFGGPGRPKKEQETDTLSSWLSDTTTTTAATTAEQEEEN